MLAGACLLAITPFFWCGSPSGHDFEFHMFSWMDVLGQWKHGIVYPRWAASAHWGYGEARFLFYPPASWTLGAALGATLPWKMVPGAYCWIVLTLAAAAMYRLARKWLPVPDALFAAVFYALNPYHLLIVYWRSAYAELLAAVLLPCVLLGLLRLNPAPKGALNVEGLAVSLKRYPDTTRESDTKPGVLANCLGAESNSGPVLPRTSRPILWLSLTLAAAWLTNEPAALMVHYSTVALALLLASRQLASERSWSPQIWRPLIRTALAILLGAGLASFYLLPAIYEQGWVNLGEVLSPGVRPQDNFLFTTIADPDHNRFNLLVSSLALAEIVALAFAIWFARNRQYQRESGAAADQGGGMLLSAWGASSAILMLSVSNLLWQFLPKLRFVQLPFRWLLCLNVALAMLLAMAAKRWTSRLLVSAVLLAALILAGHRIQRPWWDAAPDIRQMSNAVADGTGYEGTDEYVPAGADPYELKKNLPLVSDDTGGPVRSEILAWGPTEKHFRIHGATAQNLTIRLFNYPAWHVVVNGKAAKTQTADVTGLMVIPMGAGDSDVQIHFVRTIDRFVGNLVSLISLFVLVVVWIRPAWFSLAVPGRMRPGLHVKQENCA